MSEEIFTEPEETTENWVDVRMTDPEEGEWDVDFVVVDGQVNYVISGSGRNCSAGSWTV